MRTSEERTRTIAALRAKIVETIEPYFTGGAAWPEPEALIGQSGLTLLSSVWEARERVLKTEPAASAWSAAIKPLQDFFKEPHYEEHFEFYADAALLSETERTREALPSSPNEYPDTLWTIRTANMPQERHSCRLTPQGNRIHGITPSGATFALRESSDVIWIDLADDYEDGGLSETERRDRRANLSLLMYCNKRESTPAHPYTEPELYPRRTWAQALELLETRAREEGELAREVGAHVFALSPMSSRLRGGRGGKGARKSLEERLRVIKKPSKDDPARKIEHRISVQLSTRGQYVFMPPEKYASEEDALEAALERIRHFDSNTDKAMVLSSILLHGQEYAEISPGIMHGFYTDGKNKLNGSMRRAHRESIERLLGVEVILSGDNSEQISFPIFIREASHRSKDETATIIRLSAAAKAFNDKESDARHRACIDPRLLRVNTLRHEWGYLIGREANRLWNMNAKPHSRGAKRASYKLPEFLERAGINLAGYLAERGEPAAFRRIEEELEHLRETGVAPGITLERDPSGLIDASKISIGLPPPHLAAEIGRLLPTASDRRKALPAPAEIPSA